MKDRITISIVWHDHRKPLVLSVKKSLLRRLSLGITLVFASWLALQVWGFWNYTERKKLMAHKEELAEKLTTLEEKERRLYEEKRKMDAYKEKLTILESKLSSIEEYLQSRGIKSFRKQGVGGATTSYKPTEIELVEFLNSRAQELYRTLRSVPTGYPLYGELTSTFGVRKNPFGRGYEFHSGIDIKAPYGSPVKATADGIVVFTGRLYEYGNTVVINHGEYTTLYGHLSKIGVKVKQKVKAGEVIGYVGSTGRSTGPHLHYEVLKEGKAIDPIYYITWR